MNIKKQIATSLVALMMLLPPPPITQTAKAVTSTSSAEEIAKELFNYEDDAFKAIYAGVNNSYNSSTHESGHRHGSCIVVDPRITGKVEVYAQRANSTSEDEILGNRDSCSWSFSVNGKGEYSGHSRIRVEYTPSSEDIMNGAVVLCTPQPLTYTGANDLVYFDGSRRYIAIPSTPDYTYKYSTQYLGYGITFKDVVKYAFPTAFQESQTIIVTTPCTTIYNKPQFNLGASVS
jgi:hypothetical protein